MQVLVWTKLDSGYISPINSYEVLAETNLAYLLKNFDLSSVFGYSNRWVPKNGTKYVCEEVKEKK